MPFLYAKGAFMKKKLRKLLLCFTVLGILTMNMPSNVLVANAKVQMQEETIQESVSTEEADQLPENMQENIGNGLVYSEKSDMGNLTRGSPTVNVGRILDYGTGTYIYASGYNALTVTTSNGSKFNQLIAVLSLNGETVFCIEPLILTETGAEYEIAPTDSYLTSAQKINLGLIGYFGYGYNGDYSDEMMAATQIMVWRYRGYGITDYKSSLQPKIDAIQHRMDTFTTRPSFEGQSLEFEGYGKDHAITLTDSNNVLSDFSIYENGGYNIEKKGNTLKIWVDKGSKPSGTITLDRMNRDRLGNTVVWRNPDGKQTLAKVQWSDPSSMKVSLRVAVGNIEIIKNDDLGKPVQNTQFKISTTPDMKSLLGTYSTDQQGKIRIDDIPIKFDTLYYQEIFVPEPYVLDGKVKSIPVKYQETSSATVVNKHQKARITIHKEDTETGLKPQGDASLSGWVFGLYADKDKKVKVQSLVGTGNTATSDLLDVNKTYYIFEEEVPIGYKKNPNPVTVKVKYTDQTISVNQFNEVLKDDVIKGNISIHKTVDKPINFLKSSIKQPLSNVKFTITHNKSGKVVDTLVSDAGGYDKSIDLPYGWYTVSEQKVAGYDTLPPFQVFIDQDGKTYNYYIENTAIVSNLKIVKTDAETGKTIPLSGFKFRLEDSKGNPVKQHLTYPIPCEISVFTTFDNGTVTLPEPLTSGTYKIFEVESSGEYLLSNKSISFTVSAENPEPLIEVEFSNQPAKGTFSLYKQGEQLTGFDFRNSELGKIYSPIYELRPLSGVVYDIIADEDIITDDGTLRAKKGTVVDTITTKEDGLATTKELYLGKYKAIEKSTLPSFVLDKTPYHFELKYKDQHTSIVKENHTFTNARQKVKVQFSKNAETVKGQTYDPYNDIQFGLYTKEDITIGKETLPKDSLLEVIAIKDKSIKTLSTDLPINQAFYLKEITQASGYIPLLKCYDFTTAYGGDDKDTIDIAINNGRPIINNLIRSELKITKTSEDDRVQDISFLIEGITTIGTEYKEVFKTDKNGEIKVTLLEGNYTVSELKSGNTVGYITPEDQDISISASDLEIQFYNKLQRGDLEIIKSASDEKDDLSGFEFIVTGTSLTGVDYSKTFTTNEQGKITITDLLVGDYKVSEVENDKTIGYIHPEDQNITIAYENTTTAEFFNDTMKGKLVIKKSVDDSKKDLSGFEFEIKGTTLTGKDFNKTVKTNDKGVVELILPCGTYEVVEQENDATVGYITPEEQTIEIKQDESTNLTFTNTVRKGNLKIVKTTDDKRNDLSGFEFLVFGKTITGVNFSQTYMTDKDGTINITIPCGDYTVLEIANGKTIGFIMPDAQNVEIIEEQDTNISISNKMQTGTLEINKTVSNDLIDLSGFEFVVSGKTYTGMTVEETYTTDKDGRIKVTLPVGEYTISEKENDKTIGYVLPSSEKFVIDAEKITSIKMHNEFIQTPNTGDSTHAMGWTIGLLISGAFISIVARKKYAKHK